MTRLIALHGQTLNGAVMRRELAHLERLGVELASPDAPHVCPDDVVERLYAIWDGPRHAPPHRAWWHASDDGRTYRGWEQTCDVIAPMLDGGSVGLVGFSQGAILATALAALSQHGLLPPIDYVILIAGRSPRTEVLAPYLVDPIETPSLHVWGDDDHLVGTTSRELVDRFARTSRHAVTWPGGHAIPRGSAMTEIERFVVRSTRPCRLRSPRCGSLPCPSPSS